MSTDERRARMIFPAIRKQAWCEPPPECEANIAICTCWTGARAIVAMIRTSDEAAGMVLVNRDMIQQAHALLAQIMSAGHNTPGPTLEDIQDAFWRLDNVLGAAMESDNG